MKTPFKKGICIFRLECRNCGDLFSGPIGLKSCSDLIFRTTTFSSERRYEKLVPFRYTSSKISRSWSFHFAVIDDG